MSYAQIVIEKNIVKIGSIRERVRVPMHPLSEIKMFKEPIFFGGFSNVHLELPGVVENGKIFGATQAERNRSQDKHIEHLCGLLHKSLDKGFDLSSGSQQWTPPGKFGSPSGDTMEEWIEGHNKISNDIMAVIEDIALALGVKVHRTDDETQFVLEIITPKQTE